ncbi:PTS IIA-like nitrogen regulatory protein PtsN [Oceanicoccus sagamiensis]|uniref:PTS IIA-like nitrogen-regulatory protein PtsN n=1 Tax=Oceanicoccus sagamiensis TaxID=716816 RepID=A0A1X9NIY9_9GAMM|nr:PTS IIA-like nitrogen regulatory protein PtsN [Oceanicoccus sagamiensis]ARN74857.1 PTS IIA-like nitrogen-regulatory protein PtsN [Oceanicoccus sagamiensis]
MKLDSILSPGRTLCGAPGSSKKRVLENISQFICQDLSDFNPNQLFDNLVAREKLGSTGLGNGIAIPHCRITQCQQIIGTLIKLDDAVDFDAIDGQPVDLLFVLLVPEQAHDEHLNVLATLAELFSDASFCQQLRTANSNEGLYQLAIAH